MTDNDGKTAMWYAVSKNHHMVKHILREAGAQDATKSARVSSWVYKLAQIRNGIEEIIDSA